MTEVGKKMMERCVIEVAWRAGLPLPSGLLVDREKPDFQIDRGSGLLGLEVTAVTPPPRHPSFNSPLAECDKYEEIIRKAESDYRGIPGAVPVKVTTYPWEIERTRGMEREMARGLVDFVRVHSHEAAPVATYKRRNQLPRGFGVVSIAAGREPWFSGASGSLTVAGIYNELSRRIAEKNARLSTYRQNLPSAAIWLLLYSGATVSNGIEIPHGIAPKTVHEAVEAKKASGRTSRSHEMTRNLLGGTFCWQSKQRADNQVLAVLCSVFVRVNRSVEMLIATSAASLK